MEERQTCTCEYIPRNTNCFTESNLSKIQEIMYEQKIQPGAYLFWEGDVADKLYYIKSGRVKVTKSTDEGKELLLYMFQDGDMLGQIDPYEQSRHAFTAEAIEECVVGVVQQQDLEVLIWQHGELAIEFMKWIGLMHRLTQTKFRDMMMYGKPGALCSTLIRLSNSFGKKEGDAIKITKKLTHSELSDMIGATRESVNRMFGDLKKKDALEMKGGYILIKDIEQLKQICHCENCPLDVCRI